MQWHQRNVQKSVLHMQSCCFANLNVLHFSSHCHHHSDIFNSLLEYSNNSTSLELYWLSPWLIDFCRSARRKQAHLSTWVPQLQDHELMRSRNFVSMTMGYSDFSSLFPTYLPSTHLQSLWQLLHDRNTKLQVIFCIYNKKINVTYTWHLAKLGRWKKHISL